VTAAPNAQPDAASVSASMSGPAGGWPDPQTVELVVLDRVLVSLVRRYRTASHVVAARRARPESIDDETLEWWIRAHDTFRRRSSETRAASGTRPAGDKVELRKDRLRKPDR
jgi:hypothetical protein